MTYKAFSRMKLHFCGWAVAHVEKVTLHRSTNSASEVCIIGSDHLPSTSQINRHIATCNKYLQLQVIFFTIKLFSSFKSSVFQKSRYHVGQPGQQRKGFRLQFIKVINSCGPHP
jgi:hypothetical protein